MKEKVLLTSIIAGSVLFTLAVVGAGFVASPRTLRATIGSGNNEGLVGPVPGAWPATVDVASQTDSQETPPVNDGDGGTSSDTGISADVTYPYFPRGGGGRCSCTCSGIGLTSTGSFTSAPYITAYNERQCTQVFLRQCSFYRFGTTVRTVLGVPLILPFWETVWGHETCGWIL